MFWFGPWFLRLLKLGRNLIPSLLRWFEDTFNGQNDLWRTKLKWFFFCCQVRWNACYAFGNMFRNPFLPTGTASWTVSTRFSISFLVCLLCATLSDDTLFSTFNIDWYCTVPQMIPERKWFPKWTANDPHCRPQMIFFQLSFCRVECTVR